MKPVSIVTVTRGSYFFVRLLVERVRAHTGGRPYEIIAVDRGSKDGTREWLEAQPDVRVLRRREWRRGHRHGEAAEWGAAQARHDIVAVLDSDAHPLDSSWLAQTADKLDAHHRLAGAEFRDFHKANPHGWYVHPFFMVFFKGDLGGDVVLRKMRGHDADTGEEATLRLLAAGRGVIPLRNEFCARFDVGHLRVPTMAGGVFHAWYVTRLATDPDGVARETDGAVTVENYLRPLQARLRAAYGLGY
jgi:glycosyltransferase involved in cell wall biosynthesis